MSAKHATRISPKLSLPIAAIFALLLAFISPQTADATERSTESHISSEELLAELEASGVPESTGADGSRVFAIPGTPELPNGVTLVFAGDEVSDTPEAGATPKLGGGFTSNGWYILLNPTDQRALIAAGVPALAVGICAIPVVGQAACGLIGAGLGGAAVYLSENAVCRGDLRIEFAGSLGGATFLPPRCV